MNNLAVDTTTIANKYAATPSDQAGVATLVNTLNASVPKFTNLGEIPNYFGNDDAMTSYMYKAVTASQQAFKDNAVTLAGGNADLAARIQKINVNGILDDNFANIVREVHASAPNGLSKPELTTLVSNTGAIVDGFESLSEATQSKITTAQELFHPPVLNPAQAGMARIAIAQKSLDIDSDEETKLNGDSVTVGEKTAKTIRNQMAALQGANPGMSDFAPDVFDKRAVTFLEDLQAKQMKDAGVSKENLSMTLLHIWSLQKLGDAGGYNSLSQDMKNLGQTSSMLSAMSFMVSGALGNGMAIAAPTVNKTWDTGYTNNDSGDHFFDAHVYAQVQSRGEIAVTDFLKPSAISMRNDNMVEALQRLRDKAATPEGANNPELKTLIDSLDAHETFRKNPEGWKQQNVPMLNQHQVGMIAVEIMSIQAKNLCIDEKDINKSIENGRFMPHLADLKLVDTGLGFPPGVRESISYEDWPANQRKHDVFAKVHMGADLVVYRSEVFAERFGELAKDDMKDAVNRRYGHLEGKLRLDNGADKMMQSPIERYNSLSPGGQTSLEMNYDDKRDKYLSTLGRRLQEESGCTVPENLLDKNKNTNSGGVGTGKNADNDGDANNKAKSPDADSGDDGANKKVVPTDDGNGHCFADQSLGSNCSKDFSAAAKPETAEDVMRQTTGNDNVAPDLCFADEAIDNKCNPAAAKLK